MNVHLYVIGLVTLLALRTATGFRFNRMVSSIRRFATSDGTEPTKPKKNTEKTVQFTNVKDELDNNLRTNTTIKNDNDFKLFLRKLGAYAVQCEGKQYMSLESIDVDKEYTLRYCGKAAARFDGYISNSASAFEAKANVAVMNALREMGQESVELLYAAKEVSYAASNDVKGEFDGIVATASHLFVVEAKLRAQVAPRIHPLTRFDVLMPFL